MPYLSTNITDVDRAVVLETTLLAHGVPKAERARLGGELVQIVADAGAMPAVAGVLDGRGIVGMSPEQLESLLAIPNLPKLNTANLGLALACGGSGATTVSATVELGAGAGVSMMATGGLGGVHSRLADRLDVSSDLLALARFPVAVVSSGVKSLLDVASSREALETLGVPVVGFRTDVFPAFYLADGGAGVDATFDDEADLIGYIDLELARTRRGVVIVQPAPNPIEPGLWRQWLAAAQERADRSGARGRDVTPRTLAALHEISVGETLRVNLELVRANASLAGRMAALRH